MRCALLSRGPRNFSRQHHRIVGTHIYISGLHSESALPQKKQSSVNQGKNIYKLSFFLFETLLRAQDCSQLLCIVEALRGEGRVRVGAPHSSIYTKKRGTYIALAGRLSGPAASAVAGRA